MAKVKVICTSTGCIEYAPERYRNLDISFIRVHLFFKGKEHLEGLDLDPYDMYNQMLSVKDVKNDLPHTAIPTYEEVAEQFQKAIDEGYDEIFCVCIDSYLGGTYNFIRLVAKDFEDKIKITCIDALVTSFQEGWMAIKAREFFDKGMKTEDVIKEIEWIKAHREFVGIVPQLDYLILNGRLKGGKAFMGKLMKICPVLEFNHKGELVSIGSAIGTVGGIKKAIDIIKQRIGDRDPKDYILMHAFTGPSPLDKMKIIEAKEGIKTNHEEVVMSPVSGCHIGPWMAAYLYIPIRREDEPLE